MAIEDTLFWADPSPVAKLEEVLALATGDHWKLILEPKPIPTPSQQPLSLAFSTPFSAAFAVSDGLDSYAGVALWAHTNPERQAAAVNARKHRKKIVRGIYAPLKNIQLIDYALQINARKNEDSYRTRALTFFVPALLVASKLRVQKLTVLESGQGALGSALITVGREYPYVSLTPFFLRRVTALLRAIIPGFNVAIVQPHLWQTKAQVLRQALSTGALDYNDIKKTSSCSRDGRRRKKGHGVDMPCGICAGCLHRRCALVNAGVMEEETSRIYVYSDLRAREIDRMRPRNLGALNNDTQYLESAVADMRLLAELPPDDLSMNTTLFLRRTARSLSSLSQKECRERLSTLLETHRQEWETFLQYAGPDSWLAQHGAPR